MGSLVYDQSSHWIYAVRYSLFFLLTLYALGSYLSGGLGLQDVARLLMLGGALAQMPAWYVELSYAQALEACALLATQPLYYPYSLLQEGVHVCLLIVIPCNQETVCCYGCNLACRQSGCCMHAI